MNKKQLICLWGGIVVFVFIALTTLTEVSANIFGGNQKYEYGTLVVRLLCTVIVSGGLIYTLKDKERKNDKDD